MKCTFCTSKFPKVVRTCGAFHFEMRFAPQRRAFFRQPNCQKCSGVEVLFDFLTSKPASRQNDLQFLISHLPRWLRTRRFSEPTFRPSWATKHWKNTFFRDFSAFSRTCIFFASDSFSSLIFFLIPFFSLTFPTSAVSSVHIVGRLPSKLPSRTYIYIHYYIHKNIHIHI